MPTWNPPPDLHFDHDSAEELASTARSVAARLDAIVVSCDATLVATGFTWRGATSERVRDDAAAWRTALGDVGAELAELAHRLAVTGTAAHVEQRRRSDLQARWADEFADEHIGTRAGAIGDEAGS